MLEYNPTKRLNIDQVKAHPWLSGETATEDEVRKHFKDLVEKRKK